MRRLFGKIGICIALISTTNIVAYAEKNEDGCVWELQAPTFYGDTEDANGAAGSSQSSGSSGSSTSTGSKQGTVDIAQSVQNQFESYAEKNGYQTVVSPGGYTYVYKEDVSTDSEIKYHVQELKGGGYTYDISLPENISGKPGTDGTDGTDGTPDQTYSFDGFIGNPTIITSEVDKMGLGVGDAVSDANITHVNNNNGRRTIEGVIPGTPGTEGTDGTEGADGTSGDLKIKAQTDTDGTSIWVTGRTDKEILDKWIEVSKNKDIIETNISSAKQKVTTDVNGKVNTRYVINGKDGDIEFTSEKISGSDGYYDIPICYRWSIMSVDNPAPFGSVGTWAYSEDTAPKQAKHVFQWTVPDVGTYKIKCDYHFWRQYYHWEERCPDDESCYTVRVLDEKVYKTQFINQWEAEGVLVCAGCPQPKLCVGEGCENDCATNVNMICDNAHNPQSLVKTDNYTELVK